MIITKSFQHEEVLGLKFAFAPMGKPTLFVHLYFIDGLLIDTGQPRARKQILAATRELSVEQIFITHYHEDHSGNIDSLRQQHRCPAYAPPLTCEMMKNPPAISFAQYITWGDRGPVDDLIPITDNVETKNHHFELIHIPGHAPDMMALYEPDKKWLFSADLYLNSYIGYTLPYESIAEQIKSTKKVLELDFQVMFCAHNPKLTQGKVQLTKKLNFLEDFFGSVANQHQKGLSPKEICRKLNLKEGWVVRLLSGGQLSKLNMVKSVIRDLSTEPSGA